MKGITPIISTILLILITISLAGTAMVFFSKIASTASTSTEAQMNQQLSQERERFHIENAYGDKVDIRNKGTGTLTNLTFYVENQRVQVTGPSSVAPGEIATYTIITDMSGFPDKARVKVAGLGMYEIQLVDISAAKFKSLYTSSNLTGHSLFAECNPGGGTNCSCSSTDASIQSFAGYGEVTSNPRHVNTFVNAEGYKQFIENFPTGAIELGTYKYEASTKLPVLPAIDMEQQQNAAGAHMMMQFWDGRNELWQADKRAVEAVMYWELNPWDPDYGKIQLYTNPAFTLVDSGITIIPDTNWHDLELVADFVNQKYISITADGQTKYISNVNLIQVSHLDWGNEVAFAISTESAATWPHENCEYIFWWTQQYRDLELSKI